MGWLLPWWLLRKSSRPAPKWAQRLGLLYLIFMLVLLVVLVTLLTTGHL
jgi:hypothetical protein